MIKGIQSNKLITLRIDTKKIVIDTKKIMIDTKIEYHKLDPLVEIVNNTKTQYKLL